MNSCLLLLAFLIAANEPLDVAARHVDRGDVRIGPPLVESFTLTNRSTTPIRIGTIQTSCGCLAPTINRRELMPGESAKLHIDVNTLSQPAGPNAWPVRVNYSAGDTPGTLELTVRANLILEVRVEPAAVSFQVRQPRSSTITITDTRAKPLQVTQVGATLPQLRVELLPRDGASTQVKVTATPAGDAGVHNAVVWIATDDPLYPQIRVPVTLTVPAKQRVTASPRLLPLGAGSTVNVILRDSEGGLVAIDRVECDGPVQTEVKDATLRVWVPPDWNGSSWTGTIKVHLKNPPSEVLSIPTDVRK